MSKQKTIYIPTSLILVEMERRGKRAGLFSRLTDNPEYDEETVVDGEELASLLNETLEKIARTGGHVITVFPLQSSRATAGFTYEGTGDSGFSYGFTSGVIVVYEEGDC